MLKKKIFFKAGVFLLIIVTSVSLSLPLYYLRAQPWQPGGPGSPSVFINNQISEPQDANYWILNDGRLGPDDNNYIYFDPTVSGANQNSIYVESNSSDGDFIKLQTGSQDQFRVNKYGDLYMGSLYAENIVSDQTTNELTNYKYNTLTTNYHPYLATTYKFYFSPTSNKPSGSGRYIFLGANNSTNNAGRIYIIKADTGEVTQTFTGSNDLYKVAGLAVVQVSGTYRLYYASADSANGNRQLHCKTIGFNPGNNYEPGLATSCPITGINSSDEPFYLIAAANTIFMTDNQNYRVIKYYPATLTATRYTLGSGIRPYAVGFQMIPNMTLQVGTTQVIWVTAYDEGGSSGILRKFNFNLTPQGNYNLSNCEYPKLMAFDKYYNVWLTCSDSNTYYSQDSTPDTSDYVIKFNPITVGSYITGQYRIPYYTGSAYAYSDPYNPESLPYGIYYHPTFEQMIISNRKDGRVYRLTLDGQLINCDGTIPVDGLNDFQACLIDNGAPLGQMFPDSDWTWSLTDSYWTINMSSTNPSIYRGQSMRTLYIGDIFTSGHVVSIGQFINDGGAVGAGHKNLYIDTSGYNDKIDFVGAQPNVGQTGDRAAISFFGDNASTVPTAYEYDLSEFNITAEKITIGPYYDGQAAANAIGTKNKGQIYLQGMTVFGTDSGWSKIVQLAANQNLLYGAIDNASDSTSNLLKLETYAGGSYTTRFKVDKDGKTKIGSRLTVSASSADPFWIKTTDDEAGTILGIDLDVSSDPHVIIKNNLLVGGNDTQTTGERLKVNGSVNISGMTMLGFFTTSIGYLNAQDLTSASQNIIYGAADTNSVTNSGLIKLDTCTEGTPGACSEKFKVDKDGNTTISGALKTPGGLEVLGNDGNTSCTTFPTTYTDGTMYVCRWCAALVQHRELRVRLLNTWYIIRDITAATAKCAVGGGT